MLPVIVGEWICRHKATRQPKVVGVQGIQGSGKSTLCQTLECSHAPRVVALSIDDFYLPDAQLDHHHPDPRLRGRGNPGTHDLALLDDCLTRLVRRDASVLLPVYDKAAHGGRGDRSERTRCVDATLVDTVLLEGWCVGFRARGNVDDPVDAHLVRYASLFARLDALVVLRVADFRWAYRWRAEARAPESVEDTDALVDRFVPSYRNYLVSLYERAVADDGVLVIDLDAHRLPTLAPAATARGPGAPSAAPPAPDS